MFLIYYVEVVNFSEIKKPSQTLEFFDCYPVIKNYLTLVQFSFFDHFWVKSYSKVTVQLR